MGKGNGDQEQNHVPTDESGPEDFQGRSEVIAPVINSEHQPRSEGGCSTTWTDTRGTHRCNVHPSDSIYHQRAHRVGHICRCRATLAR